MLDRNPGLGNNKGSPNEAHHHGKGNQYIFIHILFSLSILSLIHE
jgi:hypothetical protein